MTSLSTHRRAALWLLVIAFALFAADAAFADVLNDIGNGYKTESAKKVGEEVIITRLIRARPEVAMLSDAMRHSQSLIGELMLNPAAALRIASGHKPDAGAFDDF